MNFETIVCKPMNLNREMWSCVSCHLPPYFQDLINVPPGINITFVAFKKLSTQLFTHCRAAVQTHVVEYKHVKYTL